MFVKGTVEDVFEGENLMGGTVTAPMKLKLRQLKLAIMLPHLLLPLKQSMLIKKKISMVTY